MLISWRQGVSGDFATASNWNPAAVPGPADDARIGAKGTYTVTSSINETVDSLTIAKQSITLLIAGGTFTTTNGGVNDGTVTVDTGSAFDVGTTGGSSTLTNLANVDLNATAFVFNGDASLEGNGKVTLSDDPHNSISGDSLSSNNIISGAGTISVTTLVNEVGGTIDATGVNSLSIVSSFGIGPIENSGTLESTNRNHLSTVGGLEIEFARITNTPLGIIEANGPNTKIELLNCRVVGGTLETRGANAVIDISSD